MSEVLLVVVVLASYFILDRLTDPDGIWRHR